MKLQLLALIKQSLPIPKLGLVAALSTSTVLFAQVKSPAISVDDVETAASQTAIQVEAGLNEAVGKFTEVVDFRAGSSAVTASQLRSIKALLASRHSQKATERIYVAAWSDQRARGSVSQKRSPGNVLLARERIAAVQTALKKLGVSENVVLINAESNELPGIFPTKEEKVGIKMNQDEDSSDYALNEAGRILHEKGGAQKAVIYIQR